MNMNRMNPYAMPYVPKLVTEEEKEMKKDVVHKEEELENQQKLVVENISEEENGWKVPFKKIQRRCSFPSTPMDVNEIANRYEALSEHEEENVIKSNETIT